MNAAYKMARAELGVRELKAGQNADIVQYFADVGHAWVKDDETAWCAAFMGSMLKRAGFPHTGALNARSYLEWGAPIALDEAREGDVLVFWRGSRDGWQGHVGFFVRREGKNLIVLGGNQSDQVNEQAYREARLLGVRRLPEWAQEPQLPFLSILRNILKGFKK